MNTLEALYIALEPHLKNLSAQEKQDLCNWIIGEGEKPTPQPMTEDQKTKRYYQEYLENYFRKAKESNKKKGF